MNKRAFIKIQKSETVNLKRHLHVDQKIKKNSNIAIQKKPKIFSPFRVFLPSFFELSRDSLTTTMLSHYLFPNCNHSSLIIKKTITKQVFPDY
jgi:hypothetical protein